MFRRIKNTLITQRKVIRAAGRDTGDHMKLSRDKITDISHKIVTALRKARELRLKKEPNDVRLEIVRAITDLLAIEEKVDRTARTEDPLAEAGDPRRQRGVGSAAAALLRRRAEEIRHRSGEMSLPRISRRSSL